MNYGFIKSKRGVLRTGLTPILITVLSLVLGCIPAKRPDCKEPFTKVIASFKVQNKNELVFKAEDLEFINDPNYVIESIQIEGEVIPHRSRHDDFYFSLNGTKASCSDNDDTMQLDCGKPNVKDNDKTTDRKEKRRFCTNANRFVLAGGTPILTFVSKILKSKGSLVIKLHGRDHEVLNGKMTVKGTLYKKCTNPPPPPPPPPPPVAPKTTIQLIEPNVSPTAVATRTFTFVADQAGVTYFCSLNNATPEVCASPKAYSNLGDGTHNFKVYAQNSSGLTDVQPPSHSWTVDLIPPDVRIDNLSSLRSSTSSDSISFQFSSDDDSATYTCAIDNGAAAPCSSPIQYSGLSEGSHSFKVLSIDSVGNVSAAPASFAWSIDKTAPIAMIVAAEPNTANNNATSLNLQFAANESATFECEMDGSGYRACVSPAPFTNLGEGNHIVNVRATDVVGNVGLPVAYSWTTDLTAPIIALGNVIPAQGLTAANNIQVEFALSEIATAKCSFDGSAAQECASPFVTNTNIQGAHSLVITAVDAAGNSAQPVVLSWTMDYLLPNIAFGTILPSAATSLNADALSLTVVPNKEVRLTAKLNGISLGEVTSPVILNNLSEGSYVLVVNGFDSLGNYSNTIQHEFEIDRTAPQVTLTSEIQGLTRLDSNTLNFSANEEVYFECNADAIGFNACVPPLAMSGLADGEHIVLVRARDAAGNVSAIAESRWIIDTSAPLTNLIARQTGSNAMEFSFSSSEPNSHYICSMNGAVAQACASPTTVSVSAGSHSFTVYAIDEAGNQDPNGATHNYTIRPPITVNILSAAPSQAVNNSSMLGLSFEASDVSAKIECSLDGSAFSECTSPRLFGPLNEGSHSVNIRALDSYGTPGAPATYNWATDLTAPIVSLNSQATGLVNINSNVIDLSASEPSSFECRVDDGSFAPCTSPVSLQSLSEGNHSVSVKAIDLAGNASSIATATWSVDTISPVTQASGSQPNHNSMNVVFSANEAATFKCSLDDAPATVCVSPLSYSGLAVGNHIFRVWATDSAGNMDITGATYSMTVRAPVTTTIISTEPNRPFTNSTNMAISFISNQSDASFQCSLNGSAPMSCESAKQYAELSDGAYLFKVQAIDVYGNIDTVGATYSWTVDTVIPAMLTVNTTSTSTTITVNWTTSEPTTSKLHWGVGSLTDKVVAEDSVYKTSHSVKITGLSSNTAYSIQPAGTDRAGNTFIANKFTARTTR